MSEESGRRRRGGGDPGGARDSDDTRDAPGARAERSPARPSTAARRRREGAVAERSRGSGGTATDVKGAPTPSRDARSSPSRGSAVARLRRFLREVVAELRKVHWPTRRQIVVYTAVVLAFVSFMVALVYLLDLAFAKAVFAIFG